MKNHEQTFMIVIDSFSKYTMAPKLWSCCFNKPNSSKLFLGKWMTYPKLVDRCCTSHCLVRTASAQRCSVSGGIPLSMLASSLFRRLPNAALSSFSGKSDLPQQKYHESLNNLMQKTSWQYWQFCQFLWLSIIYERASTIYGRSKLPKLTILPCIFSFFCFITVLLIPCSARIWSFLGCLVLIGGKSLWQ